MRAYDRVVRCTLLASAVSLGGFPAAHAACRWAYVDGRPMQNCDSPLDPPAANLSRLSPGAPPGPPRVEFPAMPTARPGDCSPGAGQACCR